MKAAYHVDTPAEQVKSAPGVAGHPMSDPTLRYLVTTNRSARDLMFEET